MTLSINRSTRYAHVFGFKGRPASLLFTSLLLLSMANSYAQSNAGNANAVENNGTQKALDEKSGWALTTNDVPKPAVNENDVSELTSGAEPVTLDTTAEASETNALEDKDASVIAAAPEKDKRIDISELAEAPVENIGGLDLYFISVGAEPIDVPIIDVRPTAILSPELRESIERQFQEIQSLKETEEAFSEQLGESFLSYGRSLMQSGRVDEARKMLIQALHIAKINNGVNSIEQRPILRELFEMNYALGNIEETEQQLRQIIKLEKRKPNFDDAYSFDMVVRLGNQYLDLYLNNPTVSELSIIHLDQAIRYFSYAVNRYGDRPLSELLLPYGELALSHHLKSRIDVGIDRSFRTSPREQPFGGLNRSDSRQQSRLGSRQGSQFNSSYRGERVLLAYLRKAKGEQDLINTLQALLALGDLNLLSGRVGDANRYYDLAWSGAQHLPATHPIVESFNMPVKLPAFTSSIVRKPVVSARKIELIPLTITIDDDGRVRKVSRDALVETTTALTNRARRIARRIKFRPIIENGKLIPISDYRYEVEVSVRKPKAPVASKDSADNKPETL